jgi:hypothetical protein
MVKKFDTFLNIDNKVPSKISLEDCVLLGYAAPPGNWFPDSQDNVKGRNVQEFFLDVLTLGTISPGVYSI